MEWKPLLLLTDYKDVGNLSISHEIREIGGAQIPFEDGAKVASVELNSTAIGQLHRFQMSIVSCSWYKPSKIAWLHYHCSTWASYAADRFRQQG